MVKIPLSLTVSKELLDIIDNEAKRRDRSRSWVVNDILKKYFKVE